MRLGSAEFPAEALVKGIEEDVLHREWVTGVSIQLSPPLGLSDLDPLCDLRSYVT
ncbi:hypothetical protein [Candidatus Hakubella thermalkaliphila]|uniref:hypothetical protein n=1 Tax=Candidatus Hakubella thermalkaliphila TaxID=2754717 RepID=UPI002A4E259E|nr:hypothetical protein [Candidatus Hakubella thermalkaliphila]